MRTKVRHIDLHPDEFLAAVAGEMSPAELGVYWMVCLLCYARGGNIAGDTDWIRAKFRPSKANQVVGDILKGLIASGRVVRDGDQIGVRRVSDELEIALRRIRDASQNGARGGRKSNNTNGVENPGLFSAKSYARVNHQPPGKEERFSHKELNLSVLTPREPTPPLPSPCDGVAGSRATKAESAEPAEPDPPTKAEGAAAFKRCIDAINGKLGVLDSDASVPPPPDPRLVEFRARLSRLNTLAGSKLRGEVRMQAWEVLAAADSLADPHALSPEMLADLDAIERLGAPEQWAEAAE